MGAALPLEAVTPPSLVDQRLDNLDDALLGALARWWRSTGGC